MSRIRFTLLLGTVFALLAAGCVPTRTTKSAGEQIDDTLVTGRVKAALASDLGAGDSIRIDVETFRRRVQLNGFIDSADKKAAATRIARSVSGVRSVSNNLRMSTTARSSGEYVDDQVLTAKVKAALAEDPVVAARQVNLSVRQGVVQLAGFVDSAEEKARAAEVAGAVGGVQQVDNQLEIKKL